jgi:hypothetical protein
MTHRRQRLPGSFQDELGGVIERITPTESKSLKRPKEPAERNSSDSVEVNDCLFERAWRKKL